MGWLSDIGDAISDAADAAADAVSDVVGAVGDAVGDAIETIGNGVGKLLHGLGQALGKLGPLGKALGAIADWLGNVVSAAFQFAAIVVRAAFNIAGNIVAGVIRIVGGGIGGLLSGDFSVFLDGLYGIGESLFGGVVAILGAFVGLVQTVLLLQSGERELTRVERATLQLVYRSSVPLDDVRIIPGFAGLFSLNSRPFTLGNRIYLKDVDTSTRIDILVHECCHVWQFRHEGTRYVGGALLAQWTKDNAYDWEPEQAGGKPWRDFNKEAQAEFIQDVFRLGRRRAGAGTQGEFFDDDPVGADVSFIAPGSGDLTAFARTSVTVMRDA